MGLGEVSVAASGFFLGMISFEAQAIGCWLHGQQMSRFPSLEQSLKKQLYIEKRIFWRFSIPGSFGERTQQSKGACSSSRSDERRSCLWLLSGSPHTRTLNIHAIPLSPVKHSRLLSANATRRFSGWQHLPQGTWTSEGCGDVSTSPVDQPA